MLNRGIRIRRKTTILVCHNNRFLFSHAYGSTVKGKTTPEEPNAVGRDRRHLQYNLNIETVFIAMASFHVSRIEWRLEEGWFRPSLDSGQLRPRSRDLEGCYWPLSLLTPSGMAQSEFQSQWFKKKLWGLNWKSYNPSTIGLWQYKTYQCCDFVSKSDRQKCKTLTWTEKHCNPAGVPLNEQCDVYQRRCSISIFCQKVKDIFDKTKTLLSPPPRHIGSWDPV